MSIHITITQEHEIVADLPAWDGPVPRKGDYIFHPPDHPGGMEQIAGCVATVTWRTHDRAPGKFVQTRKPYVEISLGA